MRLALLADIHANREAFEAVLARLATQRIDRIVLLGDIVGYGPDPEFCTEKAAELVGKGALAVIGNHDAAIEGDCSDMNNRARAAIEFTRGRLGTDHRAFLNALDETATEGDAYFVHASARAPRSWEYVTGRPQAERSIRACPTRLSVVGHVHSPHLWRLNTSGVATGHVPVTGMEIPLAKSQVWLAVMGAVGQPRDGNPAAAYGILDLARGTLLFERAPYDHFTTARKVRDAGLPHELADRLGRGR
ncbi:MAG TPA: metallophosphoesterase family protein [Rhabdaerophilum sp.]|nr:metallophosphoesterase family protein [Rhabdaerophilum sp.]